MKDATDEDNISCVAAASSDTTATFAGQNGESSQVSPASTSLTTSSAPQISGRESNERGNAAPTPYEARPPVVLAGKSALQSVSLHSPVPLVRANTVEGRFGEDAKPTPQLDDFERVKTKKTQLRLGITKFNESPSKGIALLQEGGFIENNEESICQFLRKTPELDKKAIGDYIGEGKEA
jgi:brefeldin A-inhibited guanine nucleotide-exchange protein